MRGQLLLMLYLLYTQGRLPVRTPEETKLAWHGVFLLKEKKGGNSFFNKMLDWLASKSFPCCIFCKTDYSLSMELFIFHADRVWNSVCGKYARGHLDGLLITQYKPRRRHPKESSDGPASCTSSSYGAALAQIFALRCYKTISRIVTRPANVQGSSSRLYR